MLYTIADVSKRRARAKGYTLHIRSLQVRHGDRIAITGPSGCGKSTVLDVLGLALKPDAARVFRFAPLGESTDIPAAQRAAAGTAGDVSSEGAVTDDFVSEGAVTNIMPLWQGGRLDAMADLRLRHMGYVLQTGGLLPFLTVAENMTLTARMRGFSAAAALDAVRPLAEKLGIAHLLAAMPSGAFPGVDEVEVFEFLQAQDQANLQGDLPG